jgi:hypothetical protein
VGTALGNILPLAVAAAIRPGSIIVIVLLLTTPRARSTGLAFTVGFIVAIAALGVVLLVIADAIGAEDEGSPHTWASAAKIVLGCLFLALAGRTWVARPQHGEGIPQSWLARVDGITTLQSGGLGAAVGALNGKNLLLTIGAAVSIAQTGIPLAEQFVPLAAYVAIAGLCVLAPVALYFVLGERASGTLQGMRAWLVVHGPAIMVILFLLIGVDLLGEGIQELA